MHIYIHYYYFLFIYAEKSGLARRLIRVVCQQIPSPHLSHFLGGFLNHHLLLLWMSMMLLGYLTNNIYMLYYLHVCIHYCFLCTFVPSDRLPTIQQLQDAILKTQKNAKIQVVEDTPYGKRIGIKPNLALHASYWVL